MKLLALALFLGAAAPAAPPMTPVPDAQYQPAACCKVCGKGKACGNSCIARDRRCSKGPGCACDG